ncbi:MAG: winged helix-turn-helix domain-containing protein [Candidatus Bathyarchaeia archaeon]
MQIWEDWKTKTLRTVPPWLALGIYNDMLKEIAQVDSESFSERTIKGALSSETGDTDSINKYYVQQQRLLRILPQAVDLLVGSGLLVRNENRTLRKSEDFEMFFDFTEGVQTNVEKAIRWAVYYVMEGGHSSLASKDAFASKDVAKVLVPPQSEMAEVVDKLVLSTKGHYVRLLGHDNGKWKITNKVRLPHRPPSITEDAYEKLVYAVSAIAKSKKNQIDTFEIIDQVYSFDTANVERFLKRLRFGKTRDQWQLPTDVYGPQRLIHEIDSSTRLQAGQASKVCLRLLDNMSLSVTEIASFTAMDKSTISKTLKSLGEKNLVIRFEKKGPFGEEYYVTNCDNCFSHQDKGKCRKGTIDQIKEMMLALDIDTREADFEGISNQILKRTRDNLLQMKTEKPFKQNVQDLASMWHALLEPKFKKMIGHMEKRFDRMATKEGWSSEEQIYKVIDEEGENLPLMYLLGVKHALNSVQVKHGLKLLSKDKFNAKHPPKK